MKRIISVMICIFAIFGGSVCASERVELGMHKPEPIADFVELFEGDLSSWNIEIENGAKWVVTAEGQLTSGPVDTWNAEQETVIAMKEEVSSKDYTISADVTDKRYGAMASLVFKYTSPQHFYSLRMLNIEDVDYIGFYRRNGVTLWEEEQLTLVEFPGGIRTPEKTFEISVKVEGSDFKAYVDGVLVTEYTEDKEYFTGNRVGFFQSYGDPGYDNFRIFLNNSEYDENFLYNRRLLINLGLWMGDADRTDAYLTKSQLDDFMTKLCYAPAKEPNEEYVSTDEAAETFLNALGYDNTSASAYLEAKQELMENVYSNGDMTLKNFMQMAVNSFDIKVVSKKYGSDRYSIDKHYTILSLCHNIHKDKAVLSDDGITSLTGRSSVSKGSVAFDNGFIVREGNTRASQYIGYTMEYYYEDSSTPELIDIRIDDSDVLFLYADEILSCKSRNLSYKLRESDKIKKVKIPKDAYVIYNGISTLNPADSIFEPKSGSVCVISNGSGKDVVKITSYRDIVVERNVHQEYRIFDKLSDAAFKWDKNDKISVYNSVYQSLEMEDISEGNVVSISRPLSGSRVTLMVSEKRVSGKIEEINYSENTLKINGKEHLLSKDFFNKSFVSVGDIGDLLINCNDIGVYFSQTENTSYTVAYLIRMKQEDKLDQRVWLQLFDGEVKKYPCASRVKINDKVYDIKESSSIITSYRGTFDIFEYKLNSNKEITHILFPAADGEKNDRQLSEIGRYTGARSYTSETRSFAGELLADKNAKVFLVPLDRSREDAYVLTDISYFQSDVDYYFLVGYSYGDNNETAEYIVSEFNDTPTYILKDVCLLKNIRSAMNKDGFPAKMITVLMYGGSEERQIAVDEKCSLDEAAPGDLIQYSTDLDGEVHELRRVFDSTTKNIYHYGNEWYNSGCRLIYGEVSELRKISMIFKRADGGSEIITTGCPVIIYDSASRGEKIRIGNTSDIKDFENYGTDADKALVRFEYGVPREIVIYR